MTTATPGCRPPAAASRPVSITRPSAAARSVRTACPAWASTRTPSTTARRTSPPRSARSPAMAAPPSGAAFAFIGTTTGGNYQDSKFAGVWHLYVATTYDGGQTWSTVDTTPTDPVQRGSICTGGTTCGKDRNLLDFFDVTIDKQGRIEVGYADGCTGACATGGNENYDALATIARQSG